MTVFGELTHIANKAQNFEVVAQYQFDFGLRPSVAYLHSKGKDLGAMRGDQRPALNMLMSVQPTTSTKICPPMLITKSTCLIRDDFTKASGVATDDIVAVGMVYQF